ncbi:MAG: DNA-3-methyladenine glycosylase [Bdellovibrionota bacterium]
MTKKRGPVLSQSFFAQPATRVAQDLIGCLFQWKINNQNFHVRIIETEAYLGEKDLASHASKGRTRRTEVMYGPPGYAYVYLIYGMHYMFNVVCSSIDDPQAVLIRAAEPVSHPHLKLQGPGRFSRALKITKKHNGFCLFQTKAYFIAPKDRPRIKKSSRIGVEYAKEWKDKPLRYFEANNRLVSLPN